MCKNIRHSKLVLTVFLLFVRNSLNIKFNFGCFELSKWLRFCANKRNKVIINLFSRKGEKIRNKILFNFIFLFAGWFCLFRLCFDSAGFLFVFILVFVYVLPHQNRTSVRIEHDALVTGFCFSHRGKYYVL